MKALSICQPFASLISSGQKSIETRSWRTHYRGLLAIHASAGFPHDCRELCAREPYASVLGAAGLYAHSLPTGAVVAVVRLTDCRATSGTSTRVPTPWVQHLSAPEYDFGDYSPGRYGWFLELVERLAEPVPAKGALGLWEWEAPACVAERL